MGDIVVLCVGDIVRDIKTRDIGFLVSKHVSETRSTSTGFMLLVWRIWWCHDGETRYTEESIVKMVQAGRLTLHKNN